MKCPECRRKMIFNRDIKDYYCENCKKSLDEIEKPDIEPEKPRVPEKPTTPPTPELATTRGLIFMMFGSIVLIIGPMVCLELFIIGFFLLIFGFFIVFKDRRNFSAEHQGNMKLAAVVIVIWLILNILLTLILPFFITEGVLNDLEEIEDEDIIPRRIILNYVKNINYILALTPLSITCLALGRYLAIKDLIQPKFKIILQLIVILLILSAFLSMYLNLVTINQFPEALENTTKKDFLDESSEVYSEISQDQILLYLTTFLGITAEAILILCFYWTYNYQRMEQLKNKSS